MYFDRFDIVQAYYLFYLFHYGGMFTTLQRLRHIKKYYRPNPSDQLLSGLTENGRVIYDRLVERFPNANDSISLAFGRKHLGDFRW